MKENEQKLSTIINKLLLHEKWHEAAELIKSSGISNYLAFSAIYAGIETDDEILVDQGVECALKLLSNPSQINYLSDAYYNLANAYQYKVNKYYKNNSTYFGTEKIIEKCIKYFSKSIDIKPDPRAITNLANLYDEVGRPLESLLQYEKAIQIDSTFGMAIGNKAYLLERLAGITTYRTGYLIYAYQLYSVALQYKESIISAGGSGPFIQFKDHMEKIHQYFSDNKKEKLLKRNLTHDHHKTNSNKTVEAYTEFCLKNNLYLSLHIFDLYSTGSIGDSVTTSLLSCVSDEDATKEKEIFMRLNEIKESYITGRYILWLSQQKTDAMSEISKQTILINNLDYTAQNLYTGLLKSAYKKVFSVLDKIAIFLNFYLDLGNEERDPVLNYRRIWYKDLNKNKAKEFHNRIIAQNPMLFGVYSVLDELGGAQSDERNAIEHRYKRISTIGLDPYGASTFSEFTLQTIDVYYKTKCAIVYLLNFVNCTENDKRVKIIKNGGNIIPMTVNTNQWLDIW